MHRRGGGGDGGSSGGDDVSGAAAGGVSDGKTNSVEADAAELNPLSLLFYLSCGQVLMLGAYLCPRDVFSTQLGEAEGEERIEEKVGEFAEFTIYFIEDPPTAIYYLAMGSVMSLSLAILTFVLVNRTSPVATSLLGNVRSIATVFVSSLIFGNAGGGAGPGSILGYTLTLAGGLVYALAALGNDRTPSKNSKK
jgi:hypothetical protein